MTSVSIPSTKSETPLQQPTPLPPLEPGDHLDQKTFHARYEAMPEDFRAELIGGIVFMPSPARRPHKTRHAKLMLWLGTYEEATPGVEASVSGTAILGPESEPEPDGCLIILPEKGGQARYAKDEYLEGAPEWIGEIASSPRRSTFIERKKTTSRRG